LLIRRQSDERGGAWQQPQRKPSGGALAARGVRRATRHFRIARGPARAQFAPRMISTLEHQPAGADLVQQVEAFFSPTGPLSRASNFEYRPQQQEMAVAVARALQDGEHLAVEAGTGVGKSLAYLVPAILFAVGRKKKAIVSTHTINLQEQLTGKDLPMLAAVLPVKFDFTMLKGRANYLCTRRLHRALSQAGNLFTDSEAKELKRICEWSKTTEDGSLSDLDPEPDPKVWAQVCSERGLCSPKQCGFRPTSPRTTRSAASSVPATASSRPTCWW
jgi:ATP-dependent DNA helicase DinG